VHVTFLNFPVLCILSNPVFLIFRLVVLDASLSNAREFNLPIDGGLSGPRCLYFDESRSRLYVGEKGGKRVSIFDSINIRL